MEYVRKVHLEREKDFKESDDDDALLLEIPSLTFEDPDAELLIPLKSYTNIRESTFILRHLSARSHDDFYEFGYWGAGQINQMVWRGDQYIKTVQDKVGQEMSKYAIDRALRATGVDPPQTSVEEECEFWQIAIDLSVEQMAHEGAIVPSYFFESNNQSDKSYRTNMAYHAIRGAADSFAGFESAFSMRGALPEDIKRYCSRRTE